MLLAIDAGGTTTRAVVLTADGTCLGHGRAGGANPSAVGERAALRALTSAATTALAAAGTGPGGIGTAAVAMAGSPTLLPAAQLSTAFGLAGRRVCKVSDILAMYYSGAAEPDGYALVAGTGSVAAGIRGGELARVVGGNGWLLGDSGSGFWAGRLVARAAVADLDGTGPPTSLAAAVLAAYGIRPGEEIHRGRPQALQELVAAAYAAPAVQLAGLAPLAFGHAVDDVVAASIVARVHDALAQLIHAVVDDRPGPLVAGGSIWAKGVLGAPLPMSPLSAVLQPLDVRAADDGLLGAAILALRENGSLTPATRRAARVTLRQLMNPVAGRPEPVVTP